MRARFVKRPVFESDEEEEEFSGGESRLSKKEMKNRRDSSSKENLSNYAEASSDDEFAKEHFILPSSDDEKENKKCKKRNRKGKGKGKDDESSDEEKIVYRIQHILGKSIMPQKQWRKITDGVNTRELTKFSVWQQPDEEYYDDSDIPVEKFLIKWIHSSYLHVSWETEKDLVDMVGSSARQQIKKFRLREYEGVELFEDLSKGEYFPQSYVQIERILDVDDPDVDMLNVDWENAPVPPLKDEETLADEVNENSSPQKKQPRKKRKVSKKSKMNYLHGDSVWLTVKWAGLPYSEVSFESLQDIIRRGVEYEQAMRYFFRREQKQLYMRSKKEKKGKRGLLVDKSIIGSDSSPPKFPGGELRDYQWEGVRWMLFNLFQDRNCILADEMGLGKTIQSAALLQMIKNHQKDAGPFLVIAPLSVIVNWQREIAAWTDLDAILYYGSQEDRDLIRSYEFKFLDKNCPGTKIEVIITTPETCVAVDDKSTTRIRRELSCIDWDLVIVDEAHKLKNYDSKLASTLRDEYSFKNCVLLTGTPLQNNTEELWNLLNFIARDDFSDRESFIEDFGELKTATQLEKLHKRIKPYLLRREKEYVEKSVPPKEEIIIEVELTVPQKQYYRAIYEQKTGFLYKAGAKDGPSLSNLAMELRKCCNHPFLIKGAAHEIAKHFNNDSPIDVLVKTSGKMTLLDKLLPKLFHDGHRVLIFSQFRMLLDIVEDYIHAKGYIYDRVDGSIVGKKRQTAIDRFTNNDNVFIMLLSTKAGGVGINLTAADTVIIFDSDWNPQNDIQAQARAHRIGQTKPVTVYRLLTKKTYEMVMFRAASIKLGLDYAVMHNLKGSTEVTTFPNGRSRKGAPSSSLAGITAEKAEHVSSLSRRELENLLKHGAYDMFIEEKEGVSETESRCFVDSSIEQILEKSSTFLHRENDSQVECTKPSSFAKASFVSAAGAESADGIEEVAIDDPEFWNKVVGLSVEEMEIQLGAKRKCRQFVDSYREPTDSIRSIYGSQSAAYVTDSDESVPEEKGLKRKKRRKAEPEIVPADFSAENLNTILTAAVGYGYGNWKLIRKSSKMYWKDEDLAKAVRIGMLFLLLAVCVQVESSPATVTAPEEPVSDNNDPEDIPVEEVTTSIADDNAVNKESNKVKFDTKLLISTINKYRGMKLALKVHFSNEVTENRSSFLTPEDQLLEKFRKFVDQKSLENISARAIKDSYQEFLQLSFDTTESIDSLVIDLTQNPLIQSLLLLNEKDLSKAPKRAASKAKVTELEDIFECKLYDVIAARNLNLSVPLPEKKNDEEDDEVAQVINMKKDIDFKLLAAEFETLSSVNDTPPWWSTYYDSHLLSIIAECGWPDSKKRFSAITEYLKENAMCGTEEEKQVVEQKVAKQAAEIERQRQKEKEKEKEKEKDKAIDYESEQKMDVIEESPVAETVPTPIAAAPSVAPIAKTVFDELSSKFLIQRLKALTKLIRCTDEDLNAIEKAAAKAEKSIAAAKAAEKNQRKKNVLNLLKTVQRIGYPRSTYENLPHPDRVKNPSYLLTWEEFIKEAEVPFTMEETKEIIHEAINVFNRLEDFNGKEMIAEEGFFAEIPVKLIEPTFEKTELIHQIRLILSFYSEFEIVDFIKENCKITGANIPTYKRDTNMPVWWTQQVHDIQLLKLSVQNGCSQWKKVASEPVFAYPEDYVVPPKVNGQDWVLQLTPKALEKRIFSILRGMPAIKSFPLPPPSSPQKKIAANSKNIIVPAPATKSVLWFQSKNAKTNSAVTPAQVTAKTLDNEMKPEKPVPSPETLEPSASIVTEKQESVPIEIDDVPVIAVTAAVASAGNDVQVFACDSAHNSPSNYIDNLRAMTAEDTVIEEKLEMSIPSNKIITVVEKTSSVEKEPIVNIDLTEEVRPESFVEKDVELKILVNPATPQTTAVSEVPKVESKKPKVVASTPATGTGKKGKVPPPVQSKGILHFFTKAEKKPETTTET